LSLSLNIKKWVIESKVLLETKDEFDLGDLVQFKMLFEKDRDAKEQFDVKEILDCFDGKLDVETENLTDLKNMEYVDPLVEDCECHSCTNHTKNYICHLLDNREMTGNVLLTIHNCFVYKEFFKV